MKKALETGHQVRALARSPEKLGDLQAQAEVIQGDMFDAAVLKLVVEGVDAVISVAGPPRQGRHDSEEHARSTRLLVEAMQSAEVSRLIAITGAAARVPGQKLGFKQSLLRLLLANLVAPDVIRTKDLELKLIAASSLNWTVLRPPRIGSGKPTGEVAASGTDLTGTRIDVEDITDFILSLLQTQEWDRKAPIVSSRPSRR